MEKVNSCCRLPILFIFVIINNPSPITARTTSFHPRPLHSNIEQKVAFFINDILENNHKSSEPLLGNSANQLRRQNLFTRKDRIPSNPRGISETASHGGANSPASWWSFLACEQALEPGLITVIDENLVGNISNNGAEIIGKVQGIYVKGSGDNISHMIAMQATFAANGKINDRLIFFGVHQQGLMKYQIAVIGGSGRYNGANGFAIVNAVGGERLESEKKLLFNVYLK